LRQAVSEAAGVAEGNRAVTLQMERLSQTVAQCVEQVSAVVEQNTAATEEMAAGSSEVAQAIENIASVSEENSAAVEEVSAGTEEMSAQVEEVAASAQLLADMVQTLQAEVGRFRLAEGPGVAARVTGPRKPAAARPAAGNGRRYEALPLADCRERT
jgi:methyl-accepting chemotaxis protein